MQPDQPTEPPVSTNTLEVEVPGTPAPAPKSAWKAWAAAAVLALAIVAVGFVVLGGGGDDNGSEVGATGGSTASTQPDGSAAGGFPGRGLGTFGTITAVDGSTLTVEATDPGSGDTGQTTVVKVETSADTTVTETVDGTTADLAVGDNVFAHRGDQ